MGNLARPPNSRQQPLHETSWNRRLPIAEIDHLRPASSERQTETGLIGKQRTALIDP
jgi:hypothetical protein